MSQLKTICLMAGGTGGHVFPALAIAEYCHTQGIVVHWLGTEQGLEAQVVKGTPFHFHPLSITRLRQQHLSTYLLAPIKILAAIIKACFVLRHIRPDLVIGMGGFVSGPGGIASYCCRYPLIIHEQNARAGLTNRYLAYLAKKTFTAFPETLGFAQPVMVVGNPVRVALTTLPPPTERPAFQKGILRLLVIGGSLGASIFNQLLPTVLQQLARQMDIQLWHQCGKQHLSATCAAYAALGLKQVTVTAFIEEMAVAYDWATLVCCRAGALTITELCTVGLGAILVPYPYAVDDHQTANAQIMVRQQAAYAVPQIELSVSKLVSLLKTCHQSPAQCLKMANAAYALRCVNATQQIVNFCQESAL